MKYQFSRLLVSLASMLPCLVLGEAAVDGPFDRTFTFSTLGRAAEVALAPIDEGGTLTVTLDGALIDKTIRLDREGEVGADEPVAFIPSVVRITALTLVFPSTAHPEALFVNNVHYQQMKWEPEGEPERIVLRDAAGGTTEAYAVTYAHEIGTDVGAGNEVPYRITFSRFLTDGNQTNNGNIYLADSAGRVPHVRAVGTASVTRHVIDLSDGAEHSLAAELGTTFTDSVDNIVVAEFTGAGGTLRMDRALTKAPFVAATAVTGEAAQIHFTAPAAGQTAPVFTGACTFRDHGRDVRGRIVVSGETGSLSEGGGKWDPADFLLLCDATLASPLPLPVQGGESLWFHDHTIAIPAGRTLTLAYPADQAAQVTAEGQLPNVSFADATAALELASGLSGKGLPLKYQIALSTQSGTLILNRNFETDGAFGFSGPSASALETTLILRGDHTFAFGGMLTFNNYASATVVVEGGQTTIGGALHLSNTASAVRVEGGSLTANTVAGFPTGSTTRLDVAQGAALTLTGGLAAGSDASVGAFNLAVAGTLTLGGDLHMTPARRRTLTLAGGTIAATRAAAVNCGDNPGGTETENFLVVSGGGTLTGPVTVDGVSGAGALAINAQAAVTQLRDYDGTVSGAGTIGAIEGSLGTVVLGEPWLSATGKTLADVAAITPKYLGAIGFSAGASPSAQKAIDFSVVDALSTLQAAFVPADNQAITMRLDQYADADIRWPAAVSGVTLTLIESGAYGGSVTLPHWPERGVDFRFASYDPDGARDETTGQPLHTLRGEGEFSHTHSEDGVSDILTWEDPVFTGAGAWFDVEFNGDSYNTGWFTLLDNNGNPSAQANGMLRGDAADAGQQIVMTDTSFFAPVSHPANATGGIPLRYRPYVSPYSLDYPEEWSVAVRLSAPNKEKMCILALGGNGAYTGSGASDKTYSLVFATGDNPNEIVLWKFDGMGNDTIIPAEPLFRVTLADSQTALHVFSVVCDGEALTLYMDGAYLSQIDLPPSTKLAPGLQVGQQLGGNYIPAGANALAQDVTANDGGLIDYIRFYKGALTDAAMQEIADRTPYVLDNVRYVRHVPATGHTDAETWIQEGAWQKETWNGSAWAPEGYPTDQPAEGTACRLLVAPGEYTIQVNVERQENACFYSPNRNYATLVLAPQEGQTKAGTLRLTPLGVTAHEADDTLDTAEGGEAVTTWEDQVVDSAWYTETAESTAANRTGFRYGRLRFTGGADDPIADDPAIPDFHGAGYILAGSTPSKPENEQFVWNGEIEYGPPWDGYPCSQTGKRTYTVSYSVSGATNGIFDAGSCYFSKYATVILKSAQTGTQTITETWKRTGTYTSSFENGKWVYTPEWSKQQITSFTPTDTLSTAQRNTLEMVAGLSLTRGEVDEVATWQLTGPVVVEGGEASAEDHVLGHTPLAEKDQQSQDVWVPFFSGTASSWKFYDVTHREATDNANGAAEGLFAEGVQTPGRLYLDLTAENGKARYKASHDFSKQAWYRYGYEGDATSGIAGMTPILASDADFRRAIAFQIRLAAAEDDVTLTLDAKPDDDVKVQTFHVEEDGAAEEAPTLRLVTGEDVAPMVIHRSVIAAARLDVSNGQTGTATDASHLGNALNLRPGEGLHTPVHRGTAETARGAYIVGPTKIDWDFGASSSVPRLEVATGCELTFTVGQNFRRYGTTLVAQGVEPATNDLTRGGAWIHHASEAAFLGQDVELGEGATFAFHAEAASEGADVAEEGVVLAGALKLKGNATLRGGQGQTAAQAERVPHFNAAGGIVAEQPDLTLTVDTQGQTLWHCHTVDLRGERFGLRKTGAGAVNFYAHTPPSVTGPVSVEQGTLLVTKGASTPIGAKGLRVEEDATLADNDRVEGDTHLLADVKGGATLSGGGTVKGGLLRLNKDATYVAKVGEALTATDGFDVDSSTLPDIVIDLPERYVGGYPQGVFLRAGRAERNVRRRLASMMDDTTRWDTIARIDKRAGETAYYAQEPRIPEPGEGDFDGAAADNSYAGHPVVVGGLTGLYQQGGVAYVGTSRGRTKAGTHRLNADEIGHAITCFSGVWEFAADTGASETEEYVDGSNLLLAYEFGITAMRRVTIGGNDYLVAEVTILNALRETFPEAFPADAAVDTALFRETARVTLVDGATDKPVADAAEVTGLDGATLLRPDDATQALAASGATPTRYVRIPWSDDLLGASLRARVSLKVTVTEAP